MRKLTKKEMKNNLGLTKEEIDLICEFQETFPQFWDNDYGSFCVDGEILCHELGVKDDFTSWLLANRKSVKGKLIKYRCIENTDFIRDFISPNSKFSKKEIEMMSSQKRSSYGIKNRIILTLECAKIVVQKTRTEKAIKIFKILCTIDGKDFIAFEDKRPELLFIDKLENTLNPFNIKGHRQYSILSYRIDYYIKDLNIAIEYDENDHRSYTYERHELRQALIEKELGCKFIRVSDKYSDEYNIGLVFKNLFQIAC